MLRMPTNGVPLTWPLFQQSTDTGRFPISNLPPSGPRQLASSRQVPSPSRLPNQSWTSHLTAAFLHMFSVAAADFASPLVMFPLLRFVFFLPGGVLPAGQQ